jgi:GNAT superfamily N-acetyltransferase
VRMVELTTRERVDAFWSSTLGVDATGLHTPGTRVYPHPPQRELWPGIYVLAFDFDKAVCVFAPADLVSGVERAIADHDGETLLEVATWEAMLGDHLRSAYGPILHHYLVDGRSLVPIAQAAGARRLNPGDAAALSRLRASVTHAEWTETGFTGQPALLFGIFEDGELMACANLTPGPEAASDVGIVVHPAARGKGYAMKIVAVAARQAIVMHGIARFRALKQSPGTLAIAHRLGFQHYGTNLAAYLHG